MSKMKETQLDNFPNTLALPYVYHKGILASKPSCILIYQDGFLTITHAKHQFQLQISPLLALEFIEELVSNLPTPSFSILPEVSQHYQYGLLGFLSFEFGLKLLNISLTNSSKQSIPDFYFFLPTQIDILDQTTYTKIHSYTVQNESPIISTPQQSINNLNIKREPFLSKSTQSKLSKDIQKIQNQLSLNKIQQIYLANKWEGYSPKTSIQIFKELQQANPSSSYSILETPDFGIISDTSKDLFTKTNDILDYSKQETLSQDFNQTKLSQIISNLFPISSLTGKNKINSSILIHKTEPNLREAFSGTLGYLDTTSNTQFSIINNSIVNHNLLTHFHSGQLITSKSDPLKTSKKIFTDANSLIKTLTT